MPFCYLKEPNPRDEESSSSTPLPRAVGNSIPSGCFQIQHCFFHESRVNLPDISNQTKTRIDPELSYKACSNDYCLLQRNSKLSNIQP